MTFNKDFCSNFPCLMSAWKINGNQIKTITVIFLLFLDLAVDWLKLLAMHFVVLGIW